MKLKPQGNLPRGINLSKWNEFADQAELAIRGGLIDADMVEIIKELNGGREIITINCCASHEHDPESPYIHCIASNVGTAYLVDLVYELNQFELRTLGGAYTELEIGMFNPVGDEWYQDNTIRGPFPQIDHPKMNYAFIIEWREHLLTYLRHNPFN